MYGIHEDSNQFHLSWDNVNGEEELMSRKNGPSSLGLNVHGEMLYTPPEILSSCNIV